MHLSSTVTVLALLVGAGCTRPTPAPAPHGVKLVAAEASVPDVAPYIRSVRDAERHAGRDLLVYVGAPWCEPCTKFHEAAETGQLDARFPRLTLLVFDSDRDTERLRAAGYDSQLIPLFAVPGEDGRASGRKIEGSIKGDGAVAEITPRLDALLRSTR